MGKPPDPAAVAALTRPLPCLHEGGIVEPCGGCHGEGRHVRECDRHGRCTRAEAGKGVAVCRTCVDYQTDPALLPVGGYYGPSDDPLPPPFAPHGVGVAGLPRWHPVAPPAITPTRPRLIITAVIGADAEEIHEATGPGQRAYARRCGADYVVLRDRTQDPRVPCAEKWRVGGYVPHYPGGTLWLDADVFILPDSPDIFAATAGDAIGMVDVAPRTPLLLGWAERESAALCRSQNVPCPHRGDYWNSGVWIGRPPHAAYWTPPERPFPVMWCAEELWCRRNVSALGLTVREIDPRFNWTWPEDRGFRTWKDSRPWFAHLAGMGNVEVKGWVQSTKEWRLALLRLLAAVAN